MIDENTTLTSLKCDYESLLAKLKKTIKDLGRFGKKEPEEQKIKEKYTKLQELLQGEKKELEKLVEKEKKGVPFEFAKRDLIKIYADDYNVGENELKKLNDSVIEYHEGKIDVQIERVNKIKENIQQLQSKTEREKFNKEADDIKKSLEDVKKEWGKDLQIVCGYYPECVEKINQLEENLLKEDLVNQYFRASNSANDKLASLIEFIKKYDGDKLPFEKLETDLSNLFSNTTYKEGFLEHIKEMTLDELKNIIHEFNDINRRIEQAINLGKQGASRGNQENTSSLQLGINYDNYRNIAGDFSNAKSGLVRVDISEADRELIRQVINAKCRQNG